MSAPEFPEVVEATPEQARHIASRYIASALKELDSLPATREQLHTIDHVRMYLTSAQVWLG